MIDQQQCHRTNERYRCELDVWKIGHNKSMGCLCGQSAQYHRPRQIIEKYEQHIDARYN